MRRIIQRYNEGTTNGRVTQLPSPEYDNRGTVGPPAYPVGGESGPLYSVGGDFGPYMPDQLPSDFQPGSQQQDTGSNARSGGYNTIDMQEFVDNNFVYNNSAANNSAANNSGTTLYPLVGPLGANPMVSTGIPQGGHAKQAIADYLAGKTLGDPLSYVAGQSNVPDYHALADALGTSVIDAYRPATSAAVGDNNTAHEEMMDTSSGEVSGEIETLGGGVIKYNSPSEKAHAETIANTILEGGINEDTGQPNISAGPNVLSSSDVGFFGLGDSYTDQFQENYDAQSVHAADNPYGQSTGTPLSQQGFDDNLVTGIANNSLIGKAGEYLTGNEMLPDSSYLLPPASEMGEGETYMEQLDAFGGAGPVIETQTYTPSPNPNQAAADAHAATQGSSRGGERAEQAQAAVDQRLKADAIARYGSEQAWLNATNGGRWYNNGGPISYRVQTYNNGSSGGVTTAKSGIREEEIRERQRIQSRLPQVQQQQGPLSDIGSKLAMGAIDTGIDTGIATLAGKEGLAGTLGTMMGSGGGAAAGTGMMAALGPIGIGFGLGKLFGLFNKGGEVTCSCGKPNCNCLSKMKYSL